MIFSNIIVPVFPIQASLEKGHQNCLQTAAVLLASTLSQGSGRMTQTSNHEISEISGDVTYFFHIQDFKLYHIFVCVCEPLGNTSLSWFQSSFATCQDI